MSDFLQPHGLQHVSFPAKHHSFQRNPRADLPQVVLKYKMSRSCQHLKTLHNVSQSYSFYVVGTHSVQFSRSVVSNSLWPHESQHARPPCPSPSPGVCSNSYPSSRWCHPTISSFVLLLLPSIFPSIRVFSNKLVLHIKWPKYWSFSFSISPSNAYSGFISFRMDWLDLLAVQGTLKSLLQHHSSKASILQCSAFSMVQLSHPCMTTGKTTALTRWTFVSKVMSLVFKTLSRFIIAFLPRSKCLSISWLQSPSAVILEPKKIKFVTVSIVSPPICHNVMGPDAMIFIFWMLSFKPTFSFSSFTFTKRLFSSSSLSAIVQYIIAICLRPINEKTKILIQIYLTSEAFYSLTHLSRLCPKVYFLAG